MKKIIIQIILMLAVLACILSAHAFAETVASGYCGDPEENGNGHYKIKKREEM